LPQKYERENNSKLTNTRVDCYLICLLALLNKSEIEQRKLLTPELEKTDRTEEKKEKIKVKNIKNGKLKEIITVGLRRKNKDVGEYPIRKRKNKPQKSLNSAYTLRQTEVIKLGFF
jgi:hypothetical protein